MERKSNFVQSLGGRPEEQQTTWNIAV